jgi:hypothetical protein
MDLEDYVARLPMDRLSSCYITVSGITADLNDHFECPEDWEAAEWARAQIRVVPGGNRKLLF